MQTTRKFLAPSNGQPVLYSVDVDSLPEEMPWRAFRPTIEGAFAIWSDVAGIDFEHTSLDKARIIITFQELDPKYFALTYGGSQGFGETIIERAMGPVRVFINDHYEWPEREAMMWMIAHELGHTIGIPHIATKNGQSLMEDTYVGQKKLGSLDIHHAVLRYGTREDYDEWLENNEAIAR